MSPEPARPELRLPPELRVILIGGTSHVGKSTVARHLAGVLGWEWRSTDKLAKHPGRPWRDDGGEMPTHVREHYRSRPAADLVDEVLRHYRANVLPQIEALVHAHAADPSAGRLVLEGSAVWPTWVAPLMSDRVAAVCLLGSDAMLTRRIDAQSRYADRSPPERELIDAFRARTLAFADRLAEAKSRTPTVDIFDGETVASIADRCIVALATSRK